MIQQNQYDSLLEALHGSLEKGYKQNFKVEEDHLRCLETDEIFSAAEISIDQFHRFEGNSDPEESGIIYLISTKSGMKGTLTDAWGAYSTQEVNDFFDMIKINRG